MQEVVFAAEGNRTIFGTYGRLLEAATWNSPEESDIAQAQVACLDPFFAEPASRVADIAFHANIPVVTVNYFEPYSIDPVDTTGGGDSFRAGIVYGFLKGWDENRTIQFAAAVAAINCTRFPGVMNTPTIDEVSVFMSESDQKCTSCGAPSWETMDAYSTFRLKWGSTRARANHAHVSNADTTGIGAIVDC